MQIKKITLCLIRFAGIFLLIALIAGLLMQTMKPLKTNEAAQFYFLQTAGEADCSLLVSNGYAVLIDTGEEQDYHVIDEMLKTAGINKLNCLILTHPDKDHIGSALQIVQNYSVELVLEPYFDKERETYDNLNSYLDDNRIPRLILPRTRHFTYGELQLVVYPPEAKNYNNDNNYSLAVEVRHGEVSMFFAGDAYNARTSELLKYPLTQAALYHASYHGRDYEMGIELLHALNPQYVIITAGEAGADFLGACKSLGCQMFYTADGVISTVSDGKRLSCSQ